MHVEWLVNFDYRFPIKKPQLLSKWVRAVRRESWTPTQHSMLCSEHFEQSDFEGGTQTLRRLKADALPSKFNFPAHLQVGGVFTVRYSEFSAVLSTAHTVPMLNYIAALCAGVETTVKILMVSSCDSVGTGSWVSGSTIFAGSGQVIGQCVRPGV